MIVLDRHNVIFAYGPIELFEQTLVQNGATSGEGPRQLGVPAHHYHSEWDPAEREVLARYDWMVYELQPSDVQFAGDESAG